MGHEFRGIALQRLQKHAVAGDLAERLPVWSVETVSSQAQAGSGFACLQEIDPGASAPQVLARIVLPLLQPALGTLGLITFIASWNNFIGPLVVMRSPEMYTLPLALRSMQSPVDTEWGALMAGSAIATVPLLILFAFSSKRLIEGLTTGAVK